MTKEERNRLINFLIYFDLTDLNKKGYLTGEGYAALCELQSEFKSISKECKGFIKLLNEEGE